MRLVTALALALATLAACTASPAATGPATAALLRSARRTPPTAAPPAAAPPAAAPPAAAPPAAARRERFADVERRYADATCACPTARCLDETDAAFGPRLTAAMGPGDLDSPDAGAAAVRQYQCYVAVMTRGRGYVSARIAELGSADCDAYVALADRLAACSAGDPDERLRLLAAAEHLDDRLGRAPPAQRAAAAAACGPQALELRASAVARACGL